MLVLIVGGDNIIRAAVVTTTYINLIYNIIQNILVPADPGCPGK